MTSCLVTLERGARVGLILSESGLGWDVIQCNVFDPDTLIAAGTLPRPRGAPRFVAAVEATGLDAVALGARAGPPATGCPTGRHWRWRAAGPVSCRRRAPAARWAS